MPHIVIPYNSFFFFFWEFRFGISRYQQSFFDCSFFFFVFWSELGWIPLTMWKLVPDWIVYFLKRRYWSTFIANNTLSLDPHTGKANISVIIHTYKLCLSELLYTPGWVWSQSQESYSFATSLIFFGSWILWWRKQKQRQKAQWTQLQLLQLALGSHVCIQNNPQQNLLLTSLYLPYSPLYQKIEKQLIHRESKQQDMPSSTISTTQVFSTRKT